MRGTIVEPSAKRLIGSLRNLGYELPQAVADIVDNSIAAKSTKVRIDIHYSGDDSWLRISDNGNGMSKKQLLNAMRYGAAADYQSNRDLGKFGLGLKTASLSQCSRLTVASRSKAKDTGINGYSWDLDHIKKTDRWEILPLRNTGKIAREPLEKSTGTVILWEQLDRILGNQHPYGETQQREIAKIAREIEEHLAMVFHKFLSGQLEGRKLNIFLNNNKVEAWDPFCRLQQHTTQCESSAHSLNYEGKAGVVFVEPFILPNQDQFSSLEEHRKAAGPKKWNDQQGFYFYRMDRMIQSGGWSGLRSKDEHIKLARIAIRFSRELDEAFKINVAKMKVQLPQQIKVLIKKEVQTVIAQAKARYSRENRGAVLPKPTGDSGNSKPPKTVNVRLHTLDQWAGLLLAKTMPLERPVVQAALARLKSEQKQ